MWARAHPAVPAARGFRGQGEQLPHRERLFFQARPGGIAVTRHARGRRLRLQDDAGGR